MNILDWKLRGALLSIMSSRFAMDGGVSLVRSTKEIFTNIVSLAHADTLAVAELVAMDFRDLLTDRSLTLEIACQYYNMLYNLYWCGAQRYTDMQRFDSRAVYPMAEWLRENYPPMRMSRRLHGLEKPLRIGYICTWAHFDRGNAIAPLIKTIAIEHQKAPNRQIVIYATMFMSPEFIEAFAGSGVIVRNVSQGHEFRGLDAIVNQIRMDNIDVLITDVGSAVSTYVFSRRVAPIQMWIDMGYPFWSIYELDWVLSGKPVVPGYWGIPQDRHSLFAMSLDLPSAVRAVSDAELTEARRLVPVNQFLMACFTRLIKITPEYTRVVRQLLRDIPGSHFLLVGGGTSELAESLADDPEFVGRVTLYRGLVDLAVYGRIIDVFLDTFPLSAGVMAVEMAVLGVPVVSLDDGDSDRHLINQRDPDMVARSNDAYRAVVERLAFDAAYREFCRARSVQLGRKFSQLSDTIASIEQGTAKAIAYVNAKADRLP